MTLDEAHELAKLVDASTDWIPIAIGHFIVPEELQAAYNGGYLHKVPWAVAIVKIGDVRTRTKLTSIADWEVLQKPREPQSIYSAPAAGMLF